LSPTAARTKGASRCGAPSSLCTAATSASSKALNDMWRKNNSQTETLCRSPCSDQNWTTLARTPAMNAHSRTNSPTTPTFCASRTAASPRHGSAVRHRRSGPPTRTRH
jgi:hypothetical protein